MVLIVSSKVLYVDCLCNTYLKGSGHSKVSASIKVMKSHRFIEIKVKFRDFKISILFEVCKASAIHG